MDNGASSYRRFRDDGDESGLIEIIRDYKKCYFTVISKQKSSSENYRVAKRN